MTKPGKEDDQHWTRGFPAQFPGEDTGQPRSVNNKEVNHPQKSKPAFGQPGFRATGSTSSTGSTDSSTTNNPFRNQASGPTPFGQSSGNSASEQSSKSAFGSIGSEYARHFSPKSEQGIQYRLAAETIAGVEQISNQELAIIINLIFAIENRGAFILLSTASNHQELLMAEAKAERTISALQEHPKFRKLDQTRKELITLLLQHQRIAIPKAGEHKHSKYTAQQHTLDRTWSPTIRTIVSRELKKQNKPPDEDSIEFFLRNRLPLLKNYPFFKYGKFSKNPPFYYIDYTKRVAEAEIGEDSQESSYVEYDGRGQTLNFRIIIPEQMLPHFFYKENQTSNTIVLNETLVLHILALRYGFFTRV